MTRLTLVIKTQHLLKLTFYDGNNLATFQFIQGAGKTMLMFSVSVNVFSANFPFCVVPAGGEGGRNGKYVDVCGKR